ncbi:MAG TPA: hypothetical protein VK140_16410 [Ktedonobacteraceae bacterium]|nr:hypothetical protein [Ktedonobacteraceae bacterium]
MSNYIYDEILDQAQRLPPDEQLRLLEELAAHIRLLVKPRPKHSILELEGLGAEVWKGVDVEKYIDEERNSWER